MDIEQLMQMAASYLEQGEKSMAQDILVEVLGVDDDNAEAWHLVSLTTDDFEERTTCLERALRINPNHELARKTLFDAHSLKSTGQSSRISRYQPRPWNEPTSPLPLQITIPVLLISYFPVVKQTGGADWLSETAVSLSGKGSWLHKAAQTLSEGETGGAGGVRLDVNVTGDIDMPLAEIREHVRSSTRRILRALHMGSTYHGYKNRQAQPSLRYKIVGNYEFLEPVPVIDHGRDVPLTDYNAIMTRVDIEQWVQERGVKQVWIWGYHGGKVGVYESNMAGPHGDISNSHRQLSDLPMLDKTYTVFHYNYGRGAAEAVENHTHQIEHLLNYIDGRDFTPREAWHKLLFWGKFVGSDVSHKIIRPGCGWTHYPPNAEQDYDWANRRYVTTDIEDWRPDGRGKKRKLNCERWKCDALTWLVYWMQNIPGANNDLEYQGRSLSNWWWFVGDLDQAMAKQIGLVL